MFILVFSMNRNLSNSWIMIGMEILIGICVYTGMVILLKAPVVNQAKDLIKDRLRR